MTEFFINPYFIWGKRILEKRNIIVLILLEKKPIYTSDEDSDVETTKAKKLEKAKRINDSDSDSGSNR